MTDNQRTKILMYESVLSYLGENKEITSTIRAFSWAINKFRRHVDEIKRKDKEISSQTLEKAVTASAMKDELIFAVAPVASALFAYARQNNDLALKQKTRLSQSYFVRLRDSELIDAVNGIYSLAEKHKKELKGKLSAGQVLDDLKEKTARFKNALDDKINSFVSSNSIEEIHELFEAADKIINQNLDSFVEALSDMYPEFREDYLYVRILENYELEGELIEAEEEEEE